MSFVPCRDCFQRKSAFSDRGNGECKPCRGTGEELGLIYGAIDKVTGKTTKCHACHGNKTCQTCGGRGEVTEEKVTPNTDATRSETSTARRASPSGSKEAETELRDEGTSELLSGLAGLGAPIGGLAGAGGGGGGGGSGCGTKGCLIILFLIIALPFGMYIQWKNKRDAIADLGNLRMAVVVRGDKEEGTTIRYSHEASQTLHVYVDWSGSLYPSEKPIRITLLREGGVLYDRTWRHDDMMYFNRFADDIRGNFAVGGYVVRASVEGAPPAEYAFTIQPQPPGNIFVSDIPPEWPRQAKATFQLRPGERKKIFTYIHVNGTLPNQGQLVYISLVHEGTTLFNYSNHVTEQNRDFYIPYEGDFSEGSYTARLSAPDDPPAEFAFTVQYQPGTTTTQPEAPPTPRGGLFRLGKVATCEDASAWGVYLQKSTFGPGDRFCVYAEAWNANVTGQIDLLFAFTIFDENQQVIMSREIPVAVRSSDPSFAQWQYFDLPPNTEPGIYTVRVNARNNLTGESSFQVVTFSISTT